MDSPDRKQAFFVSAGEQEERLAYLHESCTPLLGSDVYADNEGTIFYTTWRYLPKENILPDLYIPISHTHPRADIFAARSRYEHAREILVNRIDADDGSAEAAIRSMEHVLTGTFGRETEQAQAVQSRSRHLLSLFSTDFADMDHEDFRTQLAYTQTLLEKVKLNPATVLDEEKRRMAAWLLKGSLGKDSGERRNWLISTAALQAAYRRALERRFGLNVIARKFLEMREALVIERTFSREIFTDVAHRLRPEDMPAHTLFKNPDSKPTNVGIVHAILHSLVFQLEQPHVKTYRPVGRQAAANVSLAMEFLKRGDRRAIVERDLFGQTRQLLLDELDQRSRIYPDREDAGARDPDTIDRHAGLAS